MNIFNKAVSYFRHNYEKIYRIILFVVATVFIVMIYPNKGRMKYEFDKYDEWKYETLYAPFSFAIEKTDTEIQKEKSELIKKSTKYFTLNKNVNAKNELKILNSFDTSWINKYGFNKNSEYKYHKEITKKVIDKLHSKGIIKIPKSLNFSSSKKNIITLIKDKKAKSYFTHDFYNIINIKDAVYELLNKYTDVDKALIAKSITRNIEANIVFDKEKTETELQNTLNSITSTRGLIEKGDLIIEHSETINDAKYVILTSFKHQYETKVGNSGMAILIGKSILVAIPLLALMLFLFFFFKDIYENNRQLIFILILNIIIVFTSRVMVDIDINYIYITPIIIIPIIIRAFFNTKLALLVHLITILLTSFMVSRSFEYIYLQLITGIITIISIIKLHKREQFFLTSIYIFISYSLIYLGMTLIQEGSLQQLDAKFFIYFAANAGLCLLSFPLIYFFEKVFGFITDISLLEYTDSNHSLLKELSNKAPGTFQHSLQMANMAEDAANTIGANPLLIRAGSLYHDVGKIKNPQFFTENQKGSVSPHEDLTDKESARIIINHVIDGVEIARKHNIPEQIIDFIRTHHGTKTALYFYKHSLNELPAEEVNINDFKYNGPIPFSKETCILMIADAVEAATRSLTKKDETTIRNIVDKIVKSQLDEGQFNNSDISLSDLDKIKKVFVKKLLNIHHVRIAYPE